jgi:outer membrane lipoprotein LolB
MQRRFLILALLGAVLAGCATHRPAGSLPEMATWEQRQSVLTGFDAWAFRGRIAVKAGDEGFNGKLRWTQNHNSFAATVSGPLGMGTVKIVGDGRRVTLTDKDNVETVLADAEAELFVRYGWTIPINRLRFWALGIPDPSLPATTSLDSSGRLLRLEQSGWVVEITDYRDSAGAPMPRKLTASNANTRVRLLIGRWMFGER